LSILLRDADESKRPTSRGIRWSSWSAACDMLEKELSNCCKDSWSRSSESRSNSKEDYIELYNIYCKVETCQFRD
jgi:hypothetical protein